MHSFIVPTSILSYLPSLNFSDVNVQVFIPLALYLKASKIFECVRGGGERRFASKQGSKIDYESLAYGSPQEVRHTFARIVFDTVYPLDLTE